MANLVYQLDGTIIWFVPAAATQAEDAIFEVDGLGAAAGHQSAQYDFGTSARASIYAWRAFMQWASAPADGDEIRIYLKTAYITGTSGHPDNDDGVTDGAVSAEDKLGNLHYLGSIGEDELVIDKEMVASGLVEIRHRVIQVVFWNTSAVDTLTTDVNENGFMLTPVPDQIQ